jgi:hypothetical protein
VGSNRTRGMDVCVLCVLSGRGLCDELITRPEEFTEFGASFVIMKPRGKGSHSLRWVAQPEREREKKYMVNVRGISNHRALRKHKSDYVSLSCGI